jgi:thioredoxin-related protein
MKTAPLAVAFLLLSAVVIPAGSLAQGGAAQDPPKKEREMFDPKRDAAKDIEKAIKKATKKDKRIMLDVGGEWCPWCHKLDEFFLTNEEAAKILKEKYVVVKINYSEENKNEAVLSKYPEIKGYPHLFVLDKEGKLLHSQDTGELETGDHHDPDKVIPFLKKWAE